MTLVKTEPFCDKHWAPATTLSMPVYYPHLWEPVEAFERRLELFAAGCWSAFVDDEYAGYVFSHPWCGEQVTLGQVIDKLPDEPDHYYVHDLLVGKKFRKQGVGKLLFCRVMAAAQEMKLRELRLVSVLDSSSFWVKLGFETTGEIEYAPGQPGKLMVRRW